MTGLGLVGLAFATWPPSCAKTADCIRPTETRGQSRLRGSSWRLGALALSLSNCFRGACGQASALTPALSRSAGEGENA